MGVNIDIQINTDDGQSTTGVKTTQDNNENNVDDPTLNLGIETNGHGHPFVEVPLFDEIKPGLFSTESDPGD